MNEEIKFSKRDLIVAFVVGEIAAWLIWALARQVLTPDLLGKSFFGLSVGSIVSSLPVVFPLICAACLYIAYLIGRKIAVIYQIAKYVLIGGFNTLVDWGVLALTIFIFRRYLLIDARDALFGIFSLTIAYYSLFKAISFVIAASQSFFWNKFWTFKRQTSEKTGKEFLQFFVVTFVGFLINVAIASGLFKIFSGFGSLNSDQWGIVAAVVATAIAMFWNFLGYKFIVFNVKPR